MPINTFDVYLHFNQGMVIIQHKNTISLDGWLMSKELMLSLIKRDDIIDEYNIVVILACKCCNIFIIFIMLNSYVNSFHESIHVVCFCIMLNLYVK